MAALHLDFRLTHPGFTLEVAEDLPLGGVTAIFGPSGSGKSSLLRVIAGLERGAQGQVRLGGDLLQGAGVFMPPHRRGIGYVLQDARLFPHLDVAGNLRFADRRAPRGAAGPGLDEVVEVLDLAPLMARRTGALSGGETQRVALARTLLTRPRLLMLDEPLAALDDARKAEIMPYLERLRDRAGVPILYVSHAMAEVARLASDIAVLNRGRIVCSGPAVEVLADPAAAPAIGVRDAGAVIEARVVAHHPDGVTELAASSGPLFLPGVAAAEGSTLRLRILAQDVILATARPDAISALNILPATVSELHPGSGPGVMVGLAAGQDRLLARVTRRSAEALALAPGTACFAVLKSVSVAQGDVGSLGGKPG